MLYLQANEKRVGILLFGVGCLGVPLLRGVFLLSESRLIRSGTTVITVHELFRESYP